MFDSNEFEEIEELGSGILCLDMSYTFDKRAKKLIEPFKKAIRYLDEHTSLTEEEIIQRINENVSRVEFVEGYEQNSSGVGYVDGLFKVLSLKASVLEKDPEVINRFILHEMTHMIGNMYKKRLLKKNPVLISGYSKENIFDENVVSKNTYFNESAVEMFISQDNPYREVVVLDDFPINTNQDFNEGVYCINSNIIHQMLLASGIDEQEFYYGLYSYEGAKSFTNKFPKKIFDQISTNMDGIYHDINNYLDADDLIYDLESKGKEVQEQEVLKRDAAKASFKSRVRENERLIIDKILLPRLKKVPISERQVLLDKYYGFLVCEKDYFQRVTGYQMLNKKKKVEEENPWFKHVDVEIPSISNKEHRSKEVETEKDFND